MSATCPVHGTPWKLVPAGVSKKTGNPYPAFYACSEKGCPHKPEEVRAQAPASPRPAPSPAVAVVTNPGASSKATGASPKLLLLLGCMDFASRVWQQSENDIAARTCVSDLYEAWKDLI